MLEWEELGNNWLLVREKIKRLTKKEVHVQVREHVKGARLGRVLQESVETREVEELSYTPFIAIMTVRQRDTMVANYKLGNSIVGRQAARRYSNACSDDGTSWYGQPGQTARKLVSQGVPCPKEVYSLIALIGEPV